jgi:hypothetical protein
MVSVVIIQKNGDCKNHELKNCKFNDLYKKCGFKNNNHFDKRTTWTIIYKKNKLFINLFAKNNGRANTENKFDLPPPVDNDLFFGNMIIVACTKKNNEQNITNINVDTWCKIYESLMGGFENIENTDDEEEEEEEIPPELMTKHGYKKDGFIVSDGEGDIDDDETGYDESDDGESDDGESDDGESDDGEIDDGEIDDENNYDNDDPEDDVNNVMLNINKMSKVDKRDKCDKRDKRDKYDKHDKYLNDEYDFEDDGDLQDEEYCEE